MTVASGTYGTVERVQARVGDLVDGRVFSTTTVPTLAQVETILDDVAAQLNALLKRYGYVSPVVVGDDPESYAWLRAANSAGAAAIVLNTVPGESLDPDTPDPIRVRRQGLWAEFKAIMDAIRKSELPATRSVTTYVSKAYAGSQYDTDGEETTAIFKRKLTDYPGALS